MKTISESLMYKNIRRILKHNKIIFSIHRHLVDKDYQRERKRMYACAIKSKEIIDYEMNLYQKYWECPPDDYIRYGLFDKQLDIEEILDYIPMQYYYCNYNEDVLANTDLEIIDNKWNEYQLFKKLDIPQPEVFGIIKNKKIFSTEMTPMKWNDFIDMIDDNKQIFIKPTNGNCGKGIFALSKRGEILYHKDSVVSNITSLPISSGMYIVQRGLVQRSDLMEINPSSLNTLRTIVKYENDKAKIVAILLRIGRKGSVVDNSGQGGVSVEVNIKDGSLCEFAGREHGGDVFYSHPDSDYVFKGKVLRNWDNVISQIQDIVSRVKDYKSIGWDIAIGEDKVYVIELNLGWGIEHAQTVAGGFRRRMGIYPTKIK